MSQIVDAGGLWSIITNIIEKLGPWAFFAIALLLLIIVFQLQPAAIDRQKSSEERTELMKVLTSTLERNATSMDQMSKAVISIQNTNAEIQHSLEMFCESTNKIHTQQLENHTKIIENQSKILETQSSALDNHTKILQVLQKTLDKSQ